MTLYNLAGCSILTMFNLKKSFEKIYCFLKSQILRSVSHKLVVSKTLFNLISILSTKYRLSIKLLAVKLLNETYRN